MKRSELFDLLDSLVEQLGQETVLSEIASGLSVDELEFQLKDIVNMYDLEENV